MNRMTIVAIIAGCFVFAGNALAQQYNYHAVQWENNPYAAAQKAQAESKAVLLHFTADWCGPCKRQKRFVFSNPTVVRAIHQKFVPVLVDIDANKELAQSLNVRSVPFDVFVTPDGEVISSRSSPADSNNFLSMCNSVNYRPNLGQPKQLDGIAKQKRQMSPMDAPVDHRSDFRAAGPGSVSSVDVSKESRQLTQRSNYGQLINQPGAAAAKNPAKELSPQAALQQALAGLANAGSKPNPLAKQQKKIFKIPEKRLENPSAAYDPATNEFHPHRANENFDRKEFLAKQRPSLNNVPRQAPAAQPVKVTKNRFFQQVNEAKLSASKTIPGLEVSEMFNATTGEAVDPQVTGRSFARFQKEEQLQPPAPGNEVKILTDSNARIRTYRDGNTEFAQQASMIKKDQKTKTVPPAQATVTVAPEEDFALRGKCPVTLILKGQWVEGDTRWGIVHRDRTYLFSSQENYDLFKSNPDRYSPVLSGFDPVTFHEQGKLLDGFEENGVFMGKDNLQRIVLFQSPETRAKFQANPKLYMSTVRQAIYSASREHANSETVTR